MSDPIEQKSSWADVVGEELDDYEDKSFTDDHGVKTVIEYKTNDDGKKVKVTRKIKTTLRTERVNKAAAERKRWAKFGEEKGKRPGPDLSTTSVGEQIILKLSPRNRAMIEEQEDVEAAKKKMFINKKILCRICKGDHFTVSCPYKDTLQPIDAQPPAEDKDSTPAKTTLQETGAAGGKYVPPNLRKGSTGVSGSGAGAGGSGGSDTRRDDATIRVTNLSEDTIDNDIHELFRRFGAISRVYLARDRETNVCKGFAFVSFTSRDDASRALNAINGYGYDNLILRVEWAKSST